MDRRHFLRLLLATPLALELDVEKLLWVPNQQIVVPQSYKPGLSVSQIVELELRRIAPMLNDLFQKDDIFYAAMEKFAEDD